MSGRFGIVRQAIEDLLKSKLPIVKEYRLEVRSPTDDRGMFYSQTVRHRYNIQGGAVERTANVVLLYSLEVDPNQKGRLEDKDTVTGDRLVNIAEFVSDTLNEYSRCGLLSKEIQEISVDMDRGEDAGREPDDYYVWTYLTFSMSYQDDLATTFS